MLLQDTPWIGPGSVFASLEWDIFIGAIMVVAILFALVLGAKLLKKHRANRSTAVLYLGMAMLLFVAGSAILVPTLFNLGDLFKIVDDLVARLVGIAAITLYLMFAIEVFIPRGEKRQGHTVIPIAFAGINVTLLLVQYSHLLEAFLDSGIVETAQPLLVLQECIATLPFIYIFLQAWKLARRTDVANDARALMHISRSGLFMFFTYLSLAIDDAIVLDNISSLPMWVFAVLGFISFYIGVAKPRRLFQD